MQMECIIHGRQRELIEKLFETMSSSVRCLVTSLICKNEQLYKNQNQSEKKMQKNIPFMTAIKKDLKNIKESTKCMFL